jgi:prolipoprotein diacylglyceryltransferase
VVKDRVLPYLEVPALDLGFVRLEVPALLAALAIAVQVQLVIERAPRFGIEGRAVFQLLLWGLGFGLLGGHLFSLLIRHPGEARDALDWLRFWEDPSALGGVAGGLLGAYAVMHAKHMRAAERLLSLDCLVFALPFTLCVANLASALQHSRVGVATEHPLALRFPDGVSRFDLGLIELLLVIPLAAAFAWLGRRERPNGFYLGVFLVVYGPLRFALEAVRIVEVRYWGWTPAQYVAVGALVAGVAVLARIARTRRPSTS